ncbi:MAG: ATP-binding cassette domain-containing protein [Sphingomonadales bacterium]|nr:ATP-binding cassette domain-containing protein [Sphingomonadales bacterium]
MRYGMDSEILKDISFELERGSFHFLTGASGAGKSSLLKLLYLAHRPSRGLTSFFDVNTVISTRAALPKLRRRIGVVFQEFRLLEHLTAVENVMLPMVLAGEVKEERLKEQSKELLSWVGLKDKFEARPSTLSGGEKQRLAIARAVIGRPDLLLADEPTGNVDPEMAQRLMHLFVELNKIGTTTVIATHDISMVKHMNAPELRLKNGELELIPAAGNAANPTVGEV